jgi:hypothetical protein
LSKRFEYKLEKKEVNDTILDSFVLEQKDSLDLDSLLLQTGYLTVTQNLHNLEPFQFRGLLPASQCPEQASRSVV